jgi:NAD(P)-dependent dehydrogenase (short-subunit alcohol dehydrogenase family)
MSDFRDRVVLITGAASGIGQELAAQFSAEGAKVLAIDRDVAGLERLKQRLVSRPVAVAVADVTDLAALRQAVSELEQQLGPTDILIAGAGIGKATPAATFSAQEINSILQVNLLGVVNSIDTVVAGMRDRKRGQLVVLSSLASYRGLPMLAAYSASKAACNALFDSLRIELAPFGIATSTICPGWIATPMTAHLNLPARDVMSVEYACKIILNAVRRRTPYLAFPAHMVRGVWLLRYLPRSVSDWLVRRRLKQMESLRDSKSSV